MNTTDAAPIDYFDDLEGSGFERVDAEPATLERLTTLAARAKELEAEIATDTTALAEKQAALEKITRAQIPTIMEELGMEEFKLADGSSVSVKNDVKCGITEENKPVAFEWLRKHGFDGIIKTKLTSEFGKGEDARAKAARDTLVKAGFDASVSESVHAMTLKSFVKEQLELGTSIPMKEFGVYEFKEAKIKAPAKKKVRR